MDIKAPKIVTLCGSSRFCDIMAVCAWFIERDEHAITLGLHLLPNWYAPEISDHIAEAENVADEMDALHLRKIDISSEIFIVNFENYIGNSTQREIEYALKSNKTIRWYTKDLIGKVVNKLLLNLSERSEK